jgi:aspartyl/asparaginyl-tRNA synthetase
VGAGLRIGDIDELEAKARDFNLPKEDYAPYLRARRDPAFRRSAGFGLGWERFVQGVLRLPSISEACVFPRTHEGLYP